MSFRLTIWSRGGEVLSIAAYGDAAAVHKALDRHQDAKTFGLVSHETEGEQGFPNKRAFRFERLLLTGRAREAGGFVSAPMGTLFGDLHAVRKNKAPYLEAHPAAQTVGPTDPAPILPPDLIEELRDVEVGSLTGHRLVRNAMIRLDVRLVGDLAGVFEGDLLAMTGGNTALLRGFQKQATAFGERLDARRKRAALALAEETRKSQEASALACLIAEAASAAANRKASQEHAFRTLPLLETVRRSLAHLEVRNARLLSRKLGLGGRPETAPALMPDFDLSRTGVFAAVNASVSQLARLDGWPRRLKALLGETLPVSEAEMAGNPWFEGLDPERLAAIVWFGAGEQVFLSETSQGAVVGSLRAVDWASLCQNARKFVLAADLQTCPEQFRERLRAIIPDGAHAYERFLLHEIGWDPEPRHDWLLKLKGRISTSALIRQVVDHAKRPLGTGDLIEAVMAYAPDASANTIRGILGGAARHLPDGTWERRRRWDADDPAVRKVEHACIRYLEGQPEAAVTLRPAALAEAIADDPELSGIDVDADIVALAVRSSTRFEPRPSGWIVLADRAPTTDTPFPR